MDPRTAPRRSFSVTAVIAVLLFIPYAPQTHAGRFSEIVNQGAHLNEEASRFLPGAYFYRKGNDRLQRGDAAEAVRLWRISAGWAMKDAQYNLGIAYFKGEVVTADRPLGLAWLALAAERKDPLFSRSLAAAWDESSADEQVRANTLWRELRKRYADAVALPIAQSRFRTEIAQVTGSRVGMPGHLTSWTPNLGAVDGSVLIQRMQEEAELNFGRVPRGDVDVGPLQPIDTPAPGGAH